MTIAELFVAIGVKVDGADKVTSVDRRMDDAARSARRMTLGVTAINAALLFMMDTAARAGQVLQNFAINTGLSTDELQMWQHTAAGAGISVDEVTKSIAALQTQRAEFALGNPQAVGAWSLLGVSPLQDPFKVLQDLREQIQKFPDAGIARKLLGDVGLEGLMPILRSTNVEFERWNRNFIVTQKQTAQLARLNAAWQSLKLSLVSVKNQFAAALTPVFEVFAKLLERVVGALAGIAQWLGESTLGATALRIILAALVVGMFSLGAALTAVATVMSVITALGWASGLSEIVLAITAVVLAALGLVLVLEDVWTAIQGGKSVIGVWNDHIAKLYHLYSLIQKVRDVWTSFWTEVKSRVGSVHLNPEIFGASSLPASAQIKSGNSTNSQTNNVSIKVDGAQDPKRTGQEILRTFKQEISSAFGSMADDGY